MSEKTFPKEIYEGLRIPSGTAKVPKKNAKEVIVKAVMTNDQIKAREGTYYDEKEVDKIID